MPTPKKLPVKSNPKAATLCRGKSQVFSDSEAAGTLGAVSFAAGDAQFEEFKDDRPPS